MDNWGSFTPISGVGGPYLLLDPGPTFVVVTVVTIVDVGVDVEDILRPLSAIHARNMFL